MADNPLRQLEACGTAVWNDFIRRDFVQDGGLKKLVDEDGISGVTSNPTIFEKAIGGSSDYDSQLRDLVQSGVTQPEGIFRELASTDICMAADVLKPVYEQTKMHDGYVSVEVSPEAAHDYQKTLDDAHYFWNRIDRPNIMIKVPATAEGIPAVEQLISEGINVNITLIFSVDVYEDVMEAFLKGLERRVEQGQPVDHIASVASFFVSRVDTLTDKLLEGKLGEAGADQQEIKSLEGKAAIANAKIAYERFQRVFSSDRFKKLEARGAQVQRPLWASTSTKNPNYPDTMYVDQLAGQEIVNTMPPATIDAVRDHGKIDCGTVTENVEEAHQVIDRLRKVGIDIKDVTDQLTVEGVDAFANSLHGLYSVIAEKTANIQSQVESSASSSLDGQQSAVDTALQHLDGDKTIQRLWEKDPTVWKPAGEDQSEIADRLGWLDVADQMLQHTDRFEEVASTVRSEGYSHVVVLGMGGSSLAPYVLSQTFGKQDGFPELLILDSTDPEAVASIEHQVDPGKTLFIVASKSGTTTEPNAFMETFWEKVSGSGTSEPGKHFAAITDPGTSLENLAKERSFRWTFLNPADIGGRYSALSYFGMVPAAAMGLDVKKLLERAVKMEEACSASVGARQNPGAWLGAVMGELSKAGRDKVTFFLSPGISTFGLWLEQLLAESTGKEGKGLVPVPDNPPGAPEVYGNDRLFVAITLGDEGQDMEPKVSALESAGQPVVRLHLQDPYDLGAEFFRWEFATAVAGSLMGINAFNQPNVQESKDNTKRLLQQFEQDGSLPEPKPLAEQDGIRIYLNDAARSCVPADSLGDAGSILSELLGQVRVPEYVALMAYIEPSAQHDQELEPLRVALRDALHVAVTLGYGPRFLHSTGQLHKGGPPEGVFVQITAGSSQDVDVPGEKYSFATLVAAQALGDFQSLQQHGRPAVRLHLPDESQQSIGRLTTLLQSAAGRQPAHVG
jgi:transaldolase/glucose-6-phosphate isomerase